MGGTRWCIVNSNVVREALQLLSPSILVFLVSVRTPSFFAPSQEHTQCHQTNGNDESCHCCHCKSGNLSWAHFSTVIARGWCCD
jgi:hypothetical protein